MLINRLTGKPKSRDMVILCEAHCSCLYLEVIKMAIDYKQWVIDNQTNLKYTVIDFNNECGKLYVTFECNICGAIKRIESKSLYRNNKDKENMHSERCSSYYFKLQDAELGEKHRKKFKDFYRYAKERCTNPNSKDYQFYKGKWWFDDYTHYYHSCWGEYKDALIRYGDTPLSIDRIDGAKGYEDGNIRFVPMEVNLRNKDNVIPIRLENIMTGEVYVEPSLGMASIRLYGDTTHASAISRAIKRDGIFLKIWKVSYENEK